MDRYTLQPKKAARAGGVGSRVSRKSSVIVCKSINNMPLVKGKKLLQDYIAEKRSIEGRFYTTISTRLLELIGSAEQNAQSQGLNAERLFIRASAHRGFTFSTPRRFKLRGRQRKVANLQVVLEQR